MIICLVTDRHRLGAAVGSKPTELSEALERQVRAAGMAGIDMVQVREPDLEGRDLYELARRLVRICRGTDTRILVNDRLDVALAAGAAGVHLKERSFPASVARRMAPDGFLIGKSIHSAGAAADQTECDFLIAGTILATTSKATTRLLGWEGLSTAVLAAAGKPILGIGGLDLPSMPFVAASGAAGIAAVGAFIPPPGQDIVEFVQKRVTDMRLAFDSARSVF